MKRLVLAICILAGFGAGSASAADLCVGGAGCFATLQGAVDAAHDGDTIHLRRGTFAGGVTIDKSVALAGAGSRATTIAGGGPVLTVFRETAPEELTVSIRGVTITGGVNLTKPDPPVTFGGGIWIPTSQLPEPPFNGTGATVSISDSEITGNTVTSHEAIPAGSFCPFVCGFNTGGGIDNGGVLTLTNVRVTNNVAGAGSLASGVTAGGIFSRFAATLVLRRSVVSGNHVVAAPPNGRNANSGGISVNGAMSIEDSVVSDNSVELTSAIASDELLANTGGIHLSECCGVSHPLPVIRNSLVTRNRVSATGTNVDGLPQAFAGGIIVEAPLLIERTVISGNSVHAVGAGNAGADGGGLEVSAPVTIRDSLVTHNSVLAEGKRGAIAFGGGIANFGGLTLERTLVVANNATARGAGGPLPFGATSSALGGGIWNRDFETEDPPALALTDSVVTGNSLEASPGFVIRGGGLYTATPFTRTRTVIAGNRPDQCFGC